MIVDFPSPKFLANSLNEGSEEGRATDNMGESLFASLSKRAFFDVGNPMIKSGPK